MAKSSVALHRRAQKGTAGSKRPSQCNVSSTQVTDERLRNSSSGSGLRVYWRMPEITPANPNVFYEVGYAHALNKPTILIAEKGRQLPFDLSSFRTLFYENSIVGKKRIEDGLRAHIKAIFNS